MISSRTASLSISCVCLFALSVLADLQAPRIEIGQPFPEIRLPRLADGETSSIRDFRGQRVILHVFASW